MKVTVIGGANVDLQGFPNETLKFRDSNPGKLMTSLGGVGRNIAENLVRLGIETRMITAIGTDVFGNKILQNAADIGLDLSQTIISKKNSTSTYLSILDEKGDMAIAMADMDIVNELTPEIISERAEFIRESGLIIIDTNLSEETIDTITRQFADIPIFVDTVSVAKTAKIKDIVGRFHTIKPNKIECEFLTGISIESIEDLQRAEKWFMDKGVKQVFITLNRDGVYYSNGQKKNLVPRLDVKVEVVNATGAGDAFVSALAYGFLNNLPIEQVTRFSQAASVVAISHPNTINPKMSVEEINKILGE